MEDSNRADFGNDGDVLTDALDRSSCIVGSWLVVVKEAEVARGMSILNCESGVWTSGRLNK